MKNGILCLVTFILLMLVNGAHFGGEKDWCGLIPTCFAEPLYTTDSRTLLTDFLVNEVTGESRKQTPAAAIDEQGNYILAWADNRNGNWDIFCQRFSADGLAWGNNILVNTNDDESRQSEPVVAIKPGGGFIVAWTDYRNGFAQQRGSNYDVYAQLFDADGEYVGENFRVNGDFGAFYYQGHPAIGTAPDGTFIVVWKDSRPQGNYIFGQRYDDSVRPIGNYFKVTDETAKPVRPKLSMDAEGNFIVVWFDFRDGDKNIYGQRFSSEIEKAGENFRINDDTGTETQQYPEVSMNASGEFVVIWEDFRAGPRDIWGQRFNRLGEAVGNNFMLVEDNDTCFPDDHQVALDDSGNFIVVWSDEAGNDPEILGLQCDKAGNIVRFNINADQNQYNIHEKSAISAIKNNRFVVAWEDTREPDDFSEVRGIYCRRFTNGTEALGGNIKVVGGAGGSDQRFPAIAAQGEGIFAVVWNNLQGSHQNGMIQYFNKQGVRLNRNQQSNSEPLSYGILQPSIGMEQDGSSIVVLEDRPYILGQRFDKIGNMVDANFNINSAREITYAPVVDVNQAGDFAVVWENRTENMLWGKLFQKQGETVGEKFKLCETTETTPIFSDFFLTENCDLVVAWQQPRLGHPRIYCQRVDRSGVLLGPVLSVDESTTGIKTSPAIDGALSGDFVVVWEDYRNSDDDPDIYGQRFNHDGTVAGGNFLVNNDASSNRQIQPRISVDLEGQFVVVWQDNRNGNWDIWAQRYSVKGEIIGVNYQVNSGLDSSSQSLPDVVFENQTIFYTWEDTRIPGQGYDIFAKVEQFESATPVKQSTTRQPVKGFKLHPNFPNPFNPVTTINYTLGEAGPVNIQIFDTRGRMVSQLVQQHQPAGVYRVLWNARDNSGKPVSSGLYICRMTIGNIVLQQKLVLTK